MRFTVFLGAPPCSVLQQDPTWYHWQSASSLSSPPSPNVSMLPPSTLDDAGQRISLLYQNVLFDQTDEQDDEVEGQKGSWQEPNTSILSPVDTSVSRVHSLNDSLGTQESVSFNYSDTSSIARFPTFDLSLHSLTSLSSLNLSPHKGSEQRKVSLLLAALEVEGPDMVTVRKGIDKGKDISILKMILGDEDGQVCKMIAWREVAEAWGGMTDQSPAIKRGDILFISNVLVSCNVSTSTAVTLTASPYMKSTMQICYRTLPSTREDNRLRPDLRLGASDAAVKKVAAVVDWFETMAGLLVPNRPP